jgi:hypothetical protein
MPSFYSVVQYLPDPNAEERINIGVVAYHDSTVRARFLSDWNRVRSFGKEDVGYLKDFAQRFQRTVNVQSAIASGMSQLGLESQVEHKPELTTASLEVMFSEWSNSIRFTVPRASLRGPDALLDETSRRFLTVRARKQHGRRDQESASRTVRSLVRSGMIALVEKEDAEELVRFNYPVLGARQEHLFEVAVANGTPYFVAESASFEVGDPMSRALNSRLDSIAWALSDIGPREQALPVGVLMLPPTTHHEESDKLTDLFQERSRLFSDLGAAVLSEGDVEQWTQSSFRDSALSR